MKSTSHSVHKIQPCGGFTLPEVLIGIIALSLSVIASAAFVSQAGGQFRRGERLNELSQLVEADIARVRRVNDRLVCPAGACVIFTGGGEPGRNDYFPITVPDFQTCTDFDTPDNCLTADQITHRNFVWNPRLPPAAPRGLCRSTTPAGGFAQQVINNLNANAPLDPRLLRAATISADGQAYSVSYSAADTTQFLRQVALVPSIFAWCPSDTP